MVYPHTVRNRVLGMLEMEIPKQVWRNT